MKKPSTLTLVTGILFIALGVFFLVNPEAALKIMILLAAILAVVKGLLDLYHFIRTRKATHKNDYNLLISGIFILILGVLLFFNSTFGILFTGFVFAAWFAVESITTLLSLRFFKAKKGAPFYILLALSILTLVMSILMFLRPFYAALSFTIITGIYFIAQGIVITIISIKFKTWFSEVKITKQMREDMRAQHANPSTDADDFVTQATTSTFDDNEPTNIDKQNNVSSNYNPVNDPPKNPIIPPDEQPK